jgi:hypothetical protein
MRETPFEKSPNETFVHLENAADQRVGDDWNSLHSQNPACLEALIALRRGVDEFGVRGECIEDIPLNFPTESIQVDDPRRRRLDPSRHSEKKTVTLSKSSVESGKL